MLIYFRKVNEDNPEDRSVWKQGIIRTIWLKHNLFERKTSLYYVEKGDDVYGVFSYTIAKFAVIDIGDGRGEILFLPSEDPEWDEEARFESYRLISKGGLDTLGFEELVIRLQKNRDSEKRLLQQCGFSEMEQTMGFDDSLKMSIKKKMRIMVTGVNSELGFEVIQEIRKRGYEALGCDIHIRMDSSLSGDWDIPYVQLDISNEEETRKVLLDFAPDAVINCYAWSDVEAAELPEKQKDAYDANVKGTINLAKYCRKVNAKMMLLSSDYVFDGSGSEAWGADCKDYGPLNYYGKTKEAAEKTVSSVLSRFFVLRTEWTFGRKSRNFVDILLELAKTRSEITIVDDQIGVPTYFHDLARLVADMIETEKYGFYNATNSGDYVSRNEYAKEIFRQASQLGHHEYGADRIKVESVSSEEYKLSKVIRPLNSRLDISKLKEAGFEPLPDWREALQRYLKDYRF